MKRKIIYGLLAVFGALALWLYVVTVVNPEWEETFYNVPVVLQNEEALHKKGLMLMMDEKPDVTLRISGNRTDMIKLNASNITLLVDVGRLGAGEQKVKYEIVYPGDAVQSDFNVISPASQQITLNVVERKSKPVDVMLKVGDADPGYIALEEEAILNHAKITISGPADVVDRIVTAEIAIDLTGEKETISRDFDYVLRDAEGNAVESKWIKATPEKVNCTLNIQKLQEVTIAVDVVGGTGLTPEDCEITFYNQETGEVLTDTIAIFGSETQLAVLRGVGLLREDKLFLEQQIVLSQMVGKPTADGGVEIELTDLNLDEMLAPYEITKQSLVNVIKVVVKIPDREIKTLNITEFAAENLPERMKADFKTPYVTVTLRGPKWELDWVTEKNVEVIVDFAGVAPSENNKDFPARVVVSLGDNTFAVGTYKVNAVVSAANG